MEQILINAANLHSKQFQEIVNFGIIHNINTCSATKYCTLVLYRLEQYICISENGLNHYKLDDVQ